MTAATASVNPPLPSNKKFGWFFVLVFTLVAVYLHYKQATLWPVAFLGAAALTAIITFVIPAWLAWPNRLWYGLGMLLGKIVSPLVLGLIFFLLITPVAVLTRLMGRDVLLLKKRNVASYWVKREPHGPAPESFKNQF